MNCNICHKKFRYSKDEYNLICDECYKIYVECEFCNENRCVLSIVTENGSKKICLDCYKNNAK